MFLKRPTSEAGRTMFVMLFLMTSIAGCSPDNTMSMTETSAASEPPFQSEVTPAILMPTQEAIVVPDKTKSPSPLGTPTPTLVPMAEEHPVTAIAVDHIPPDAFWSSDGRSLLFPDWTDLSGNTWKRLDLATTQIETVPSPANVSKELWDKVGGLPPLESISPMIVYTALSPSGRWLSVLRMHSDIPEGQLVIVDTEGGEMQVMASPGACAYNFGVIPTSWSTDENVAAFICGAEYGGAVVEFVDLNTGETSRQPLQLGVETLQFDALSPDGRYYAYMANGSSLRVADWRTGSEIEVGSINAITLYGWRGYHELIFIQNESQEELNCDPFGILSFQPDTGESWVLADFPMTTDKGNKVSASCRRPFLIAPNGHTVIFDSDDGSYLITQLP